MISEASQHAAEDTDRRERIEARNTADGLVYQAERFLVQVGDGLPEEMRQNVERKIGEVSSWVTNPAFPKTTSAPSRQTPSPSPTFT